MLDWLRRRFVGEEASFDEAWRAVLASRFEHWNRLTDAERPRMEQLVARFMERTRWEAAQGFELTEDIKVLIAAQASMLLLGLDLDEYPQLTSVIVHPSTVRLHGRRRAAAGTFTSGPYHVSGQAHYRGPVVLSWAATRRGAQRPHAGTNVVYHEFAHQLDMLDGVVDGTPPIPDPDDRERWVEVCTAAFERVRSGTSEVLRAYAGTDPGEFFAVATEAFFNVPVELATHEPELYAELRRFYRQDPATAATAHPDTALTRKNAPPGTL